MLEILTTELNKQGVFSTSIPEFIKDLAQTIPNTKINDKMKLTIAVSELILFASQFRRNILHFNSSLIPINAITFCISPSGVGKDSSINIMRKNFKEGYAKINSLREQLAVDEAIAKAKEKNQARASDAEVYMKFYIPPMPLFVAPSTPEGYIQYLNTLDKSGIASGFITSSEFGAELLTSPVIISNLQLLSELYDEGKKEVKVLKDKEKQSSEIKNLPVSALFVGSPENILFDESIKRKFKVEFTSKLARRSFFNFNNSSPKQKSYTNIKEFLRDEMLLEDQAREISEEYNKIFSKIAATQLNKKGINITISTEARMLLTLYKEYNQALSETIKRQYPISRLVRAHMHWKALKLSGAIAIFKDHDTITDLDYKEAITFTELLSEDMMNFEMELVKEPYELFVGLVSQSLEDNKCFMDVHTLKKLGYIQGNSGITTKLKELATLAGSYDNGGVYKASESGIEYSKIVKTNYLGVSYKVCKGSKEERSRNSSTGFSYAEVDFKALGDMLQDDYAFCPFMFKDGIRNKNSVVSGCKWLALDVDTSLFTDEQTHHILASFNHHIVRTSNKDNGYKFRVLLELDSFVDLDEATYKAFVKSICEYLALEVDILPKSQIYFSYKGRKVLSTVDKEPIEVREHLIKAYDTATPKIKLDNLNSAQKQALLEDPLTTFSYAFEAKDGEGSISLIRAAKHAKDLGMDKEAVLDLMENINRYWGEQMERKRFENTILNQIRNWRF